MRTSIKLLAAFMLFAGLNPLRGQGRYFDISKNLEIFANAYKEVNHSYVDDLDPSKVMRSALDAMLEGLDPYTNYISETDIEGYRIQTDGKYNGIGAQGFKMGDFVVITDIDENSPAHKAGLKAGDAIVSVDGQSAMGKTEAEVLAFLRGFPGTEADLLIRRPGENKDLKIKLTREEVDIPNVPHSGLVSENVGYVYLSTFTREAARNVGNAIQAMKNQNPDMKGVILDLRGNGGGLLNEAVNLVNLFVPRGEIVAVTKGKVREWNNTFKTINGPLDENIPVVVLLDKMSASASEVTAGALQDLDRAVLMGQRSYGKGLVQNMLDIGYNARVKVTTAKYYIPSGRCIQAVRYRNGEPVDIPESERAKFKTRNGRTVLDGGGVKPDVLLPHDTATGVVKALLDQHIIFDFATQFALKHESIDSAEAFTFTDWDGFMQFAKSKNFDYESVSEKKLKELKSIASSENFALDTDIQALENRIKAAKKNELNNNKARIMHEIEQEIVGRYYFQRGKVRKNLKNDPEVDAAVKLLNDEARYRAILAGNS